jgi:hypothetical protein
VFLMLIWSFWCFRGILEVSVLFWWFYGYFGNFGGDGLVCFEIGLRTKNRKKFYS